MPFPSQTPPSLRSMQPLSPPPILPDDFVHDRFKPKPGEGPSRQMLESGFFNVMVYGKAEGSGRECVCHVRGIDGDPGYKLTGAMALEAAICLATSPDVQRRGGVLTPAVCMGDVLPEYTAKANVTFTTTDVAPPLFEACKPPESKL